MDPEWGFKLETDFHIVSGHHYTSSTGSATKRKTLVSKPRSLNSRTKVPGLKFINKASFTVRLYWVDFKGKLRSYGSLTPGKTMPMNSFATHPWVAKDPKGYIVNINGGEVYTVSAGDKGKQVIIEASSSSSSSSSGTTKGGVNIVGRKMIDLISNNCVLKRANGFKSQIWYFDGKTKTIRSRRTPSYSF
jgi:hypothetical protein